VLLVTAVHDEIISDQDGGVTLTRSGSGTRGVGTFPGHDFEVENMQIIVVVFAVPATKDKHAGSVDQISCVVEPGEGSASTFGSLIPCHCDGVERMKVFEDLTFLPFSSEDDNSLPGQHGRMPETLWRWRPLNPWLDPPTAIQIQHMSVVQV